MPKIIKMTTKELYLADMRELLKEAEDKLQQYNNMYICKDTPACDDYQRFVYNGRLEWEGRVFSVKERLIDIKHNFGEGWDEQPRQNFFEQPLPNVSNDCEN